MTFIFKVFNEKIEEWIKKYRVISHTIKKNQKM